MEFQPKPVSELRTDLVPGLAQFEVMGAKESVTKVKKSPTMELKLMVTDSKDKKAMVFDHLYFGESSMWKLYAFCKSIGKEELYKSGKIDLSDIDGLFGTCKLGIKKSKDPESEYAKYDGNIEVQSYIVKEKSEAKVAKTDKVKDFNDDVPF